MREHCWHFANEYGMGHTYRQICCFCGWSRDAIRHDERDPEHGPHQPGGQWIVTWTYGKPRPTTSPEYRGVPGLPMVELVTVPDPGCGLALTPSSRTATDPETP